MLKTVSNVVNAIGALNYKGTWNASTNNPTLTSSVGTKGDYYVVSVAGSTNLDGETLWGVGDWAVFNGSTWQKVDGGDSGNFVNISVSALTGYMFANGTSNVTASTAIPVANVAGAVPNTTTITAAGLLSGGGNLASNVTITLNNVPNANVTGLGTMATQNANAVVITGGTINTVAYTGGTFANANITSVAATFPNSYLANSTATLGNATITLGGTTSTVGNLTLSNVTISTGSINVQTTNHTANVSANATYGTSSLLLVPQGFLSFDLNGTVVKVPYYAV